MLIMQLVVVWCWMHWIHPAWSLPEDAQILSEMIGLAKSVINSECQCRAGVGGAPDAGRRRRLADMIQRMEALIQAESVAAESQLKVSRFL